MQNIKNTQNIQKENVLLIINPVAGRRLAQLRLFQIVESLTKNGCKTTVFTTSRKGDATELVENYGGEADRIICCGGDGTLHEVVTGLDLSGLQVPVGYIPTGTTNDLANALNLPTHIDKAIDTAVNGKVRGHDIGRFNEQQRFTYIASFGAFTNVAYETPQWAKNTLGPASYVINGIIQVVDIKPRHVHVTADGTEISGDFVFGSVSNSTIVGGIIKFSKSSVLFNDGMFEVMLIKNPTTPHELGTILNSIFREQYDEQNVHFFKASSLKFSFEEQTQWTLDGEYAGEYDTVNIENRHGALQIARP